MSKQARDMTQAQFDRACEKRGFVRQGFLGYYCLADTSVRVSVTNVGTRRRTQLAYLIAENKRWAEAMEVTP